MVSKAVPAVYRPSFRRLEWHFAFLAAVRANSLAHFARSAVSATAAAEAATASAAPASAATVSAVSASVVISISHLYSPIFFQGAQHAFACKPAIHRCKPPSRYIQNAMVYKLGGTVAQDFPEPCLFPLWCVAGIRISRSPASHAAMKRRRHGAPLAAIQPAG